MKNAILGNSQLGIQGIFVYQAGAVFLNFSKDEFLSEQKTRKRLLDSRSLRDWREIRILLTERHECKHFYDFLMSPWLAFFNDLFDLYMSTLSHAWTRYRASRDDVSEDLMNPLADSFESLSLLRSDVRERIERAARLRSLQSKLLFEAPTVGDLLFQLNEGIAMIAASKGLSGDSLCEITSDLPYDSPVSANEWTCLHLMEAGARWQESGTIHEFGGNERVRAEWWRDKMFGVYLPILDSLEGNIPLDSIALAISLSLRAPFFPFRACGKCRIEDVHPVMVFEKMIGEITGTLPSMIDSVTNPVHGLLRRVGFMLKTRRSSSQSGPTAALAEMQYRHLVRKFSVVTDNRPFSQNEISLESRFQRSFPEVFHTDQFQLYLRQRARLGVLRDRAFAQERFDPLVLADIVPVKPDRMIGTDCVYSNDDESLFDTYAAEKGPLSAYDRRLLATGVGELLIFGTRDTLESWTTLSGAIGEWYGLQMPKEDEILQSYGVRSVAF